MRDCLLHPTLGLIGVLRIGAEAIGVLLGCCTEGIGESGVSGGDVDSDSIRSDGDGGDDDDESTRPSLRE